MAYKDIRAYIEALEKTGDVVRVKQQVDWDLEVGAIVRRTCERQGPAILFENVKDYPGHAIFGAPIATFRRLAVAMGLEPATPPQEIMDEYDRRIASPVKPIRATEGVCQEVVVRGEEVNLFDLPAPMVHDGDGGRYIGTWHMIVVKDPDSDWTNWGMYRLMIHNRKYMGGLCLPYSDQGRIFYGKYVPQNKPMPFAVAIGTDPLCGLVSMAPFGVGVSEVDYAGALRQEPVELVKCITNDIEVPANSEIVIEGEILPHDTVEEGPFGEYTGYRTGPRMPRSVYKVTCITHRKNPILTMSNMGMPVDDCALGMAVVWRSEIKKLLETHGIPLTGVYVPPEGVTSLVVVGVKKTYTNIAQQIGYLIFGSKFAAPWTNYVLVVDEDVNPYDMREVIHAWVTKCNPSRGITKLDQAICSPLIPYLNLEERKWSKGYKAILDCTWPLEWDPDNEVPPKSAFNQIYPPEIREKVLANWRNYGLPE